MGKFQRSPDCEAWKDRTWQGWMGSREFGIPRESLECLQGKVGEAWDGGLHVGGGESLEIWGLIPKIVPVWSFDPKTLPSLSWEHPWKSQGSLGELLEELGRELQENL